MASTSPLIFYLERLNPEQSLSTIRIDCDYVNSLYDHILENQRSAIRTYGFVKGTTPLSYFEVAFKNNVLEHLQDVLFTHCVVNFLYRKLDEQKIAIAGEPLVYSKRISTTDGAEFIFLLSHVIPSVKTDWKKIAFKAPTRKNYKDLDRQVEHFMHDESERIAKEYKEEIGPGDWIYFSMSLVNNAGEPLLNNHQDYLWIRLGNEDIDRDALDLFKGRKVNDAFITTNDILQEYISYDLDTVYTFLIRIIDRIPNVAFSFDLFKKHFKLKTARDLHSKLIEVFSFRNDISQRRETIGNALSLLLRNYPFETPEKLVQRQLEMILKAMHSNPDYNVYKSQPDFKQRIYQLAQKQVKENIFIDVIAHNENIIAEDEDILTYLNLNIRPRTKEFIYFGLPSFKARGHETPIPAELVRHCCLQEKTLNHIIYHLTRRS